MLKALIVEDEAALHMLYGQVLKSANFDVIKTWNGNEAIEYLENNDAPRIIVLDMKMPESNGYDVLTYLQNYPNIDNIHVVIATAHTQASEYVEMLPSAEIIYKPLVLPALRDIAKRYSEA